MAQEFSVFLVGQKKTEKESRQAPKLGILPLTMQEAFTRFCGLLGGTKASEA